MLCVNHSLRDIILHFVSINNMLGYTYWLYNFMRASLKYFARIYFMWPYLPYIKCFFFFFFFIFYRDKLRLYFYSNTRCVCGYVKYFHAMLFSLIHSTSIHVCICIQFIHTILGKILFKMYLCIYIQVFNHWMGMRISPEAISVVYTPVFSGKTFNCAIERVWVVAVVQYVYGILK